MGTYSTRYVSTESGHSAGTQLHAFPKVPDLPNDYLAEDASNLGLVLNRLKREPKIKIRLLNALSQLYDGVSDFDVIIEGGTV